MLCEPNSLLVHCSRGFSTRADRLERAHEPRTCPPTGRRAPDGRAEFMGSVQSGSQALLEEPMAAENSV